MGLNTAKDIAIARYVGKVKDDLDSAQSKILRTNIEHLDYSTMNKTHVNKLVVSLLLVSYISV